MTIRETLEKLVRNSQSDRFTFICQELDEFRIPYRQLPYASGRNLEITIPGAQTERELILCAHHDIYYGIKEGANDNSSSVAVLLHLAQTLSQSPSACTIRLLFNDHEELLGGLLNRNLPAHRVEQLIESSGSYHYFMHQTDRSRIQGVIVLEMCGIGDSLMIGESSGHISCDGELVSRIETLAQQTGTPSVRIPFLFSDMVSVRFAGLKGTVIGAVNQLEAAHYLKSGLQDLPSSWKNIHTRNDQVFSIRERSLQMVYHFLKDLVIHAECLLPAVTLSSV